jgi:hypothetical protein
MEIRRDREGEEEEEKENNGE